MSWNLPSWIALHCPNSSFLEIAFAVNTAGTLWTRFSLRLLEIFSTPIEERTREQLGEIKTSEDAHIRNLDIARLDAFAKRYLDWLEVFAAITRVRYRKVSALLAAISAVALYLNQNGWWVLFLPLTPFYGALYFLPIALLKRSKLRKQIRAYKAVVDTSEHYEKQLNQDTIDQELIESKLANEFPNEPGPKIRKAIKACLKKNNGGNSLEILRCARENLRQDYLSPR